MIVNFKFNTINSTITIDKEILHRAKQNKTPTHRYTNDARNTTYILTRHRTYIKGTINLVNHCQIPKQTNMQFTKTKILLVHMF